MVDRGEEREVEQRRVLTGVFRTMPVSISPPNQMITEKKKKRPT